MEERKTSPMRDSIFGSTFTELILDKINFVKINFKVK